MSSSPDALHEVRFGDIKFDLRTGEVCRNGQTQTLQEKPFQILVALLERRGELITREELKKRLWNADTFVDFDQSLNRAMSRLREALDDSAEQPRYIETFSKRGYRFIAPVTGPATQPRIAEPQRPIAPPPAALIGSKPRIGKIVPATVVFLAAIASVTLFVRFHSAAPIDSIAVIPFTDGTGDPQLAYLDDGLTASVINNLSQLPRLKLMSGNAVARYRGKTVDAREAGQQLGVGAVLTGRVIKQGDQLLISVELLDARDNSHIWGEQYSRTTNDLVTLQGDLSRDIANQLRLRLTGEEARLLSKSPTQNPEAYQLFLQGHYFGRLLTLNNEEKAQSYFQQAIAKDPNFALAHAGLAQSYSAVSVLGLPPRQVLPKARAAALRALALDDTIEPAHSVLAQVLYQLDGDYPAADREYLRAMQCDPHSSNPPYGRALELMPLKRFDEARTELQHSMVLDPIDPLVTSFLAMPDYFTGQYDAAAQQLRKAIDLHSFWVPHMFMGRVLTQQKKYEQAIEEYKLAGLDSTEPLSHIGYVQAITGKESEARKTISQLLALSKQRFVNPSDIARIYAGLGENDAAFEWLERSTQERELQIALLNIDPEFNSLRTDPRFQPLLQRMGLVR